MDELKLEYLVTDQEIRDWMDSEIVRMGNSFANFEITWGFNGIIHWLEIWSNAKLPKEITSDFTHGRILQIAECGNDIDLSLPAIRSVGRELYYKLKKSYSVKRNLGKSKDY